MIKENAPTSIGFCGALTILFIALKLVGKIDWSWAWVLSPLWIPTALVLAIILFIVLCALVALCISSYSNSRKRRKAMEETNKRIGAIDVKAVVVAERKAGQSQWKS